MGDDFFVPLRPMFDRVLLKRQKMKQSGSILLPDEAARRHAPNKGEVVAVGPNADPGVKKGSFYVFGAYSGTWINENGTPLPHSDAVSDDAEFYLCVDTDLLAEVVEK